MDAIRVGWRLAGVALAILAAGGAVAQTSGNQIEEVVVTAQKRSESLQDVPLSITAISAATLEERSIDSFIDYAGQVPSLAFAYTGDGSGTARTISIRGVSGDNTTGFYIDETPVPDSIDPRVVDIERIEVLRGPQGTLYGARSMGGTVRLITTQPDVNTFFGRASASGGKTDNAPNANYGADGAVNIPLIQGKMGLRLTAFYDRQSGFFTRQYLTNPADANNLPPNANPLTTGNLPLSTTSDVGRVDTYGAAASLLIRVSDNLSITPRVMYQNYQANGFWYADNGSYPVPGPPSGTNVPVDMHGHGYTQARFYNIPENADDSWILGTVGVNYDAASYNFVSSTSIFYRKVDETEDQTDFLWQNLEAPFDGIPLGDVNNPNTPLYHAVPIPATIEEIKQVHRFVQELRMTSKLSGPWQYVAGLYFSDTRGRVPYAGYYPPSIAPGISQTGGFVRTGDPGVADSRKSRQPGRDLRAGLPDQGAGAGGLWRAFLCVQ